MNYCNYIVYMPTLQIVKFCITERLTKRLREIGRAAARKGEQKLQWTAIEALPGIARITETELRRIWRKWAAAGHLEWVTGGELDYTNLIDQTKRIQEEMELLLGGHHAR